MYYLSLAAILKNESLYIKEWLDFYIKQGIEHFYLYNNESEDNLKEVVQPYIDRKVVTWHEIKGVAQQGKAYNHAISTYREDTKYCAFLDCDEFLYSKKHSQFTETFFKFYDYEEFSGLAVQWLLFGSSGELEYRPEPVTKRFIRRADSVNQHVKSIIKLQDAISWMNPHAFYTKKNVIDENFNVLPVDYALNNPASANIFRVNHYVTKSKAECEKRRLHRRADTGEYRTEAFFEAHDRNEIEDKEIWRVL